MESDEREEREGKGGQGRDENDWESKGIRGCGGEELELESGSFDKMSHALIFISLLISGFAYFMHQRIYILCISAYPYLKPVECCTTHCVAVYWATNYQHDGRAIRRQDYVASKIARRSHSLFGRKSVQNVHGVAKRGTCTKQATTIYSTKFTLCDSIE